MLRDYQQNAVNSALAHWGSTRKEVPGVLVLPTGSGKSHVIAELCHKSDSPVLILQPSKEILEQNYTKLRNYGIDDIGIYSASAGRKDVGKYLYATIGSIYKKPEMFQDYKTILMDECHFYSPKNSGGMYNKFFKEVKPERIVGLTATPYRQQQRYVYKGHEIETITEIQMINRIPPFYFRQMLDVVGIRELIEQGYLVKPEYVEGRKQYDIRQLRLNSTGADYREADVRQFWDDGKLKDIAKSIDDIEGSISRNLIFCSTIEQAQRCSQMLTEMKLSSEWITSEDSMKDRTEILKRFREGKIKHLCNVGILTTGFDFPELDCITVARPTLSLALWYQMVGRGMRKYPGKDRFYVIDICNNVKRLGRVETITYGKEEGYKDIVLTELGKISGIPLREFTILRTSKTEEDAEQEI